jgi:hypothetical protein
MQVAYVPTRTSELHKASAPAVESDAYLKTEQTDKTSNFTYKGRSSTAEHLPCRHQRQKHAAEKSVNPTFCSEDYSSAYRDVTQHYTTCTVLEEVDIKPG